MVCFIQEAGNEPNQATAKTDEPSSVTTELPSAQNGGWVSRWMDKEASWMPGPPYCSWFCASWQACVLLREPAGTPGRPCLWIRPAQADVFWVMLLCFPCNDFPPGASQQDDEVPGCLLCQKDLGMILQSKFCYLVHVSSIKTV